MKFHFRYKIHQFSAVCDAESLSEARRIARTQYVMRVLKFAPPGVRFRMALIDERDTPVELDITELQNARLRELYRSAREGLLNSIEQKELSSLTEIVRSL